MASSQPARFSLRAHSELARLSVALELDGVYACWLALRDYDSGRGLLPVGRPFWQALTIRYQLGSQRTARRLLAAGDGIFWTRTRGQARDGQHYIALRGLARVTAALIELADEQVPDAITAAQATTSPAGRQIEIDRSALISKPARRKALYAAWVGVCGDEGLTASQKTLAGLWGVSDRTIRSWDSSLHTESNWILAPLSAAHDAPDHAIEIETDAGPVLTWRGPNTRWADAPRCPRGMAYRMTKRSRSRQPVTYADDGQTAGLLRLFFRTAQAMYRVRSWLAKRAQNQGRDWRPAAAFLRLTGGMPNRTGRKDLRQWRGRWWAYERL